MGKVGVTSFLDAIREVWRRMGGPENDVHIELFQRLEHPQHVVRVASNSFRSAEDAVDESWEMNR